MGRADGAAGMAVRRAVRARDREREALGWGRAAGAKVTLTKGSRGTVTGTQAQEGAPSTPSSRRCGPLRRRRAGGPLPFPGCWLGKASSVSPPPRGPARPAPAPRRARRAGDSQTPRPGGAARSPRQRHLSRDGPPSSRERGRPPEVRNNPEVPTRRGSTPPGDSVSGPLRGLRCRPGHGRYAVPAEVHSEAAGETGQEGGEGLEGGAGQGEEGPAAEERGVCPCVRGERHSQEERRCELAAHGLSRGRSGLQGADSCDHEGGDQEHGAGDQSPGPSAEQHGPAEGVRGDGQVRAAGAEPGRAHLGDGGLHELGHHADHATGAGGQPHHADRRGERPGGAGPAQPAARRRVCRGRELRAQPGGPAVAQVGRPEELGAAQAAPGPRALPLAFVPTRSVSPHCSPHSPAGPGTLLSS